MQPAAPTRVVVTDANVLINLIHAGRLELLGALPAFEEGVRQRDFVKLVMPVLYRVGSDEGHLLFIGTLERGVVYLTVAAHA